MSSGPPSFGMGLHPDDRAGTIVNGRMPHGASEIVLETSALKRSGLSVGDTTSVVISGEIRFSGNEYAGLSQMALYYIGGILFNGGVLLGRPGTMDAGSLAVGDAWLAQVARSTGPVLDERIRNPLVRVDGPLATVWVDYSLYLGDRFVHCGVDAFHLVRTPAGWRIIDLADTRRREGCPDGPGPARR